MKIALYHGYELSGSGSNEYTRNWETKSSSSVATSVYPVFVKDKQRAGNVKSFPEMSKEELREYHDAMTAVLRRALVDEEPDILHTNHLVYQPFVAVPYSRNY